MILSCQNISKSFGTNSILENGSFHIEDREKAAVIGINGAGKSTLLKIIMNKMKPDEGEVIISKGKTLGYLAQHQLLSSEHSIYEELLDTKKDIIELEEQIRSLELSMKTTKGDSLKKLLESYHLKTQEFEYKNGYAYQSEIIGILKGLGFLEDEFERSVNSLSGGQKTRVSLGKLLLTKPDILLLDEPTNHLDMTSIAWLETFLINYPGAVIIVSHDRYFIDKVVTKIIEIENKKISSFQGNYKDYAIKKELIRNALIKQYVNQQREIKHQEEVITKLRSFNREKSIKRAESREKLLNKIEVIEKPTEVHGEMKINLEPRVVSGKDVLTVRNLSKSYPPIRLFTDLNFDMKRGEKVAIIGNNGTGKTTILKIINNIVQQDSGEVITGSKVKIGYYDQEHNVLHPDKNLIEEISDEYPSLTNTQIRNVLAAFLFTNDDVFKKIRDLSGGERGRVSLAKLMLSEANFLILDEPTNHLDIISKEILENALNGYTGTVLYVSHDRYFINKTASRILELTDEILINYIGNYDYYLEKHDELMNAFVTHENPESAISDKSNEGKIDWISQKEEQARIRKKENDLKKTEESIHMVEERLEEIDHLLTKEEIYTNVPTLMELNKEKTSLEEELENLMEKWESLAE